MDQIGDKDGSDASKIIKRCEIPIWRKYILSVQEASEYFYIGYKKLRIITNEHPNEKFILWNGTRPQIKRKLFE